MMTNRHTNRSNRNDTAAEKFLEQLDAYIIALARKNVPRNLIHPAMVADEIDELAQKMRIKLWEKLQKETVVYPRAYVNRVAYTEAIDMVRQLKSVLWLTTDQDGEISQGNPLVSASMQDPAEEFDQEESLADCITRFIENLLELPLRQQQSVIWALRNELDNFPPLVDALKDHGIDPEIFSRSYSKREERSLRSSLAIARKKLGSLKI